MSAALQRVWCVAAPFVVARMAMAQGDGGLPGYWSGELRQPVIAGTVAVAGSGEGWRVRAGGHEVVPRRTGDSLVATLPAGSGSLRMVLRGDRPEPIAWFVQPSEGYAGHAIPVALTVAGPQAWRGTITPAPDRFTLILRIWRGSDGRMLGAFRNPEAGWNLGRVFLVGRDGESVTLGDTATGRVRFRQPYDSAAGTIAFDFGQPLVLRRVDPAEVAGLAPRSPALPPYTYRAPTALADGWPVAASPAARLDPAPLQAMVRRLAAVDPMDDREPLVHSVQVARGGVLVLDEYFRGFAPDQLHDTRSAFKSVVSLMAGVASDRGLVAADLPVFPALGRPAAGTAGITLAHLLSHSSGLACDDNDERSPGNEERLQSQREQPDWAAYMLDLPVVAAPGTAYRYCSGTMHLAGALVAGRSGRWLPAFFHHSLAEPLGIRTFAMNLAPDGAGYGGGGTRLTPRDLLKFGELMASGGTWQGRRVVSTGWIRRSTAPAIEVPGNILGHDGLGWHLGTVTHRGRTMRLVAATGNGGQVVMAIPELHLVVGFTGGSYNRYGAWRRLIEEYLPTYILPAVH